MCAPTASSMPAIDRHALKLVNTMPPQADTTLSPPTVMPVLQKQNSVASDVEGEDAVIPNPEPNKWKGLCADLIFPCLRTPLAFLGI